MLTHNQVRIEKNIITSMIRTLIVRVVAIDYAKNEVSLENLTVGSVPAVQREHLDDFCRNAVRMPASLIPSYPPPTMGDRYVDARTGDLFEVVNVNYITGDVDVREIGPTGPGPIFTVSDVSFNRLFIPAKMVYSQGQSVPSPQAIYGSSANPFPTHGSGGAIVPIPGMQGLAAWPQDPPLPPGQSNEFFVFTMTHVTNKCTCGVDSVGVGMHSSWCDKETEEKK